MEYSGNKGSNFRNYVHVDNLCHCYGRGSIRTNSETRDPSLPLAVPT
jgi:hypothetical protein